MSEMMQLLFGFNGRTRRLHYWLASFGAGIGCPSC